MSEINELQLFILNDVLNEHEFYFSEHIDLMELFILNDVLNEHEFSTWKIT